MPPYISNKRRASTQLTPGLGQRLRTAYNIGNQLYSAYRTYRGGSRTSGPAPRRSVKTKFRNRGARSYTRTKTKKNNPTAPWPRDGNGVAYRTIHLNYKKHNQFRLRDMLGEKGSMRNIFYGGHISTQGVQAGKMLGAITTTELKDLHTTLNNGVIITSERAIRFNLNQTKWEIEFMNCGPAPMELDIWHLIDKNTSISSPGGVDTEWQQALDDEAGGVGGAVITHPWSKPTDVKRFNLLFWSKRYPKSLAPGEKVKFCIVHNVNRVLDYEHLQRFTNIRGITHQIYLNQRGTVGDGDKGTGFPNVPPIGGVTLSRSKLAYVAKFSLTGHMLATKSKRTRNIGALPTNITALWTQNDSAAAPQDTEDGNEYA